MTWLKSLLEDFDKEYGLCVTFGDNSKGFTKGHGTLKYNSFKFFKVSYVKGLKYNLIAISQLCIVDYDVYFNKKECMIVDWNKVVLSAKRQEDIYIVDMFSTENSLKRFFFFFSRAQSNINWLWNKRVFHLNFKTISK